MALSRVPGDDNLFIGSIFCLRRPSALKEANITHILSVLRGEMKDFSEVRSNYTCLQVEVDDIDDEDLLVSFPETNKWIAEGLKKGDGVLVHCAMGKSRSVTLAVAYLLHTRPNLNPEAALALIRESRPIAEPNSGFMEQLELYHQMGAPSSSIETNPIYARWRYRKEVDLSTAAGMAPDIDVVRFEDEDTSQSDVSQTSGAEREQELRCKRCRKTLATSPFLIAHTPKAPRSKSTVSSDPISSLAPTQSAPPPCQHHFLHPLSWMRPALATGMLNGRLSCPNPKCDQNIGKFAWQGLKCSCGEWICPAFSLARSKVDVVDKPGGKKEVADLAKGVAGLGIRRPPGATAEDGASVDQGGDGKPNIRMPPGMRKGGNL